MRSSYPIEQRMHRDLRFACVALGLVMSFAVGCKQPAPSEADVLNVAAKLPTGLPVPVLEWRTITSGVDRVHGMSSLLTGNDVAVKYSGTDAYPDGSVLALTTWAQRDDPHWFGARIPGSFVSLEMVTVARGTDGKLMSSYKRYVGDPAREVVDAGVEERKAKILAMRAEEMP
jgi:hypothetical protein